MVEHLSVINFQFRFAPVLGTCPGQDSRVEESSFLAFLLLCQLYRYRFSRQPILRVSLKTINRSKAETRQQISDPRERGTPFI